MHSLHPHARGATPSCARSPGFGSYSLGAPPSLGRPLALAMLTALLGCSASDPHGPRLRDGAPAATSTTLDVPSDPPAEAASGAIERRVDDRLDDLPPNDPGSTSADADGDGIPDAEDCDPQSSAVGRRLLEDSLASATGVIASALPPLSTSPWSYQGGSYRQMLVRDAADVSLFNVPTVTGSFVVDVQSASTGSGSFYPRLRQDFIVVAVSATGAAFSGVGCGIEVVEGESPELKASLVRLSGAPTAITTSPLKRASRPPVQTNESFAISMHVDAKTATITCTVKQAGGSTTVAAQNVGTITGGVGLYTRQMSALFSKARICQVQ